ncbi:MAG: CBS domain-containing protein [Methanoregula sp.]|jgi:CBS domain-containing protein|uniref:CBS domain-containing protein n=1 Tax=Methanoregula sp. TaxID=2052170 RepID=UPI003D0AA35B
MKTARDFMLEIPVLNCHDGITKARQILRDDRFREVYVTGTRKDLLGYVDITDALRVTATKSNVTVEGFVKDAACAGPEASIESVAKAMREFRTDSAAIIDPGRHILGGVLLSDLFPVIISRNELSGRVSTHMSKQITTVKPADTLQQVYMKIVESGFTAFPVIKKKRLVGLISRRDLIRSGGVRSAIAQSSTMTVEDVMAQEVVTISGGAPLSDAARLMVDNDISRLPVLDGLTLVGILDRHDVLVGLA